MKSVLFHILFFNVHFFYAQEILFPDLEGDALLQKIVEEYKPRAVLDYSDARMYMFENLSSTLGIIEGVYTGFQLDLPADVSPIAWLAENGINTEHIYPRSKGAAEENGNVFSDLHHLKPAKAAVNTARLNHPFQDIDDNRTTRWFRNEEELFDVPTVAKNEYSEVYELVTNTGFIEGEFEPRESVKGDIARAVFYFYTMYREEALKADAEYFDSMLEDLCGWHLEDEIDEEEIRITHLIAAMQDDKANPFVLDCTLILRTYCNGMNLECSNLSTPTNEISKSEKISIYPNPSNGQITITSGEVRFKNMKVFNTWGQVIRSEILSPRNSLSYDLILPKGLYTIRLVTEGGVVISKRALVIK